MLHCFGGRDEGPTCAYDTRILLPLPSTNETGSPQSDVTGSAHSAPPSAPILTWIIRSSRPLRCEADAGAKNGGRTGFVRRYKSFRPWLACDLLEYSHERRCGATGTWKASASEPASRRTKIVRISTSLCLDSGSLKTDHSLPPRHKSKKSHKLTVTSRNRRGFLTNRRGFVKPHNVGVPWRELRGEVRRFVKSVSVPPNEFQGQARHLSESYLRDA